MIDLRFGECSEIMKDIPTKSIDMTFTSPPFKDEDVLEDYWTSYDKWMKEIFRITSKVVIIVQSVTKLIQILQTYPPKRILAWGEGINQCAYRWNPVLIYQISESYKVNKYIWCDALGIDSITGKWKVAKYQDPDLLYFTIIKMFKDCQTVLDPFMGSGTTGIACQNLAKDFIGIENDPKSFEIAKTRLHV